MLLKGPSATGSLGCWSSVLHRPLSSAGVSSCTGERRQQRQELLPSLQCWGPLAGLFVGKVNCLCSSKAMWRTSVGLLWCDCHQHPSACRRSYSMLFDSGDGFVLFCFSCFPYTLYLSLVITLTPLLYRPGFFYWTIEYAYPF